MSPNKLKGQSGKPGKHIKLQTSGPSALPQVEHPVFCLRYLDGDYGLEQCEADEKCSLVERFHKLSQLNWQQIISSQRHGLGSETIKRTSIKRPLPKHLTQDVTLIALRFQGNKPMVGYRNGSIFHVLWIDRAFTLYDHG